MKRDAIISLCIALPVANLPFWQWRSPAEMLLMVGLFWQVAFVAVVGTGYKKRRQKMPAHSSVLAKGKIPDVNVQHHHSIWEENSQAARVKSPYLFLGYESPYRLD